MFLIRRMSFSAFFLPHLWRYFWKIGVGFGSSLKYPEIFVGKQREVELSGEAYFNVAKSDIPFEISVGGSKIRVYGTRFNVKLSCYGVCYD